MSACTTWANGLPQPHATLIVNIASVWKTHLDLYTLRKEGFSPRSSISKPDLNRWLSYYLNHRKLTDETLAYFGEAGTDLTLLPNLYGNEDKFSVEDTNALIDHQSQISPLQLPNGKEFIFPPSVAFTILVWFPCMFLIGDYPPVLLRKARHGDFDILCELISVDRSVLFDPVISKQVHEWTTQFQEYKLKRIGTALAKGLNEIPTVKVKIAWAQYAYDAAKAFGMPLTAPKIRALFDAIAQDDGVGTHDPDIAEMTDDAFYQALTKRKKVPTSMLRFKKG